MVGPQNFLPSSFGAVVGSGIQDKHPGSATLTNLTVNQKKTVFSVFCKTYLELASCLHLC
jgi:hypothetical protein